MIANGGVTPPKTYDLVKLAKLGKLYFEMSEVQKDFLGILLPLNIEVRYPSYKANIAASLGAILYGSYAKGSAREDSDIDVAVVFNGFQGDWLMASAKLWKLRRNISDDIEPILLDHTNDESGFLREVLRTGRVIYRA